MKEPTGLRAPRNLPKISSAPGQAPRKGGLVSGLSLDRLRLQIPPFMDHGKPPNIRLPDFMESTVRTGRWLSDGFVAGFRNRVTPMSNEAILGLWMAG